MEEITGRNSAAADPRRVIFHVDMDAFFVSVEELFDPSLKGKAVVVGGHRDERGVVSAASYAARKFGVHSAMPLRTAAKLCPDAIFVNGHPERYREYSGKAFEVLKKFSPKVEMASIDEAYLDMTGTERLHGPPLKAAHALHQFMKSETKLNCSIGIGTSRLIAKVCSDQAKPNGVLYIVPGQEASFLAPLSVRKIPGVGKVFEQKLNEIGIKKVGDLAKLDDAFLRERFGEWGLALAGKSRGLDAGGYFDRDVAVDEGPKSISHEHTFNTDTRDQEKLEAMIARLSEMVCRRVREHELHARTVQIKLRYSDFTTITRAHSLEQPTQLDTVVAETARTLFRDNWQRGRTIRLIGVHVAGFDDVPQQLDLLTQTHDDKVSKALSVVDRMRDKFGENAVSLATGLKSRFREKTHENPASLPGKSKKKE
ncbi:DNA-directed DNA polymerase [Candidatus Koribacter versatilis Ellin345]|uniref:DNA polymerase IV n=1 Tax=Koribacter versatilis (strain Ellin345) TaxID=204669 RepID=Q1IRF1_KORVE|nr:DNA polymerase IV [Candidatus Koribacter versatilis]ABF40549.1 DNA-directed DNA polymerase [Candidatus Koribacter versatilis Ellin345]